MNEPTDNGRRIVSKGRYVANTMNKAVLTALGIAVFLLGIVGTWFVCCFVLTILWSPGRYAVSDLLFSVLMVVGGLSACLYAGKEAVKSGKAMDVGVPLTRANTAHLPAADSLVRASSEPVESQGSVLLRATLQTQDTPAEELLRAIPENHRDV